ncbi:MAG TPA: hypothetical protein VN868_02310, partial [Terriglobales bacterium]|nr:hypothetical protein [Terriglobales bacterium]
RHRFFSVRRFLTVGTCLRATLKCSRTQRTSALHSSPQSGRPKRKRLKGGAGDPGPGVVEQNCGPT